MLWARLLADAVVVIHAGFVAFVLLGMAVIVVGLLLGWGWVRNPWFRVAHLTAILVVTLEALTGMHCPLTTWENALRLRGGLDPYPGEFFGRWAHDLIFFSAEPWVFTLGYSLFGAAVVGAFVLGPPRMGCRKHR